MSEDWGRLMERPGTNNTLRVATLAPGIYDIRGTASCENELSKAIDMRFEALEKLIDHILWEWERRKNVAETGNCEDGPDSITEAPKSFDGHTLFWHACTKLVADHCGIW